MSKRRLLQTNEAMSKTGDEETSREDSQSFVDLSKTLCPSTRHMANALNRSKLDWTAQKLYGRDTELQLLSEAFASMDHVVAAGGDNPNQAPPLMSPGRAPSLGGTRIVFVSGAAGTGKTSLVNQVFKSAQWFASGKYNQLCPCACTSTTMDVFSQLCEIISAEASDETLRRIAKDLKKEMGRTVDHLIESVSGVATLIVEGDTPSADSRSESSSGNRSLDDSIAHSLEHSSDNCSLDLLLSMLRKLLECISKNLEDPIVLFFDDIQWSDSGSLRVLDSLLEASDIKKMLIVAAFRDSEKEGSELATAFSLEQTEKGRCSASVVLESLQQLDVANLLLGLTKTNRIEDVQPLAALVEKRTDGNAFFVIEFIKGLEQKKLMKFSTDSFQYEWDVELIKAETDVCANVTDLISFKVDELPIEVVRIMMVSSILGNNFLVDVLASVVCANGTDTMDSVEEALDYAQSQGIMEAVESKAGLRYKFVHDCLQKLAYDLVGEDQKAIVHWHVGWALYVSRGRSDSHKFLSVEHLNKAVKMGAPNVLGSAKLAKLNLVTAIEARAVYAFVPARTYLLTAMEILEPEDPWETYYDMMLEITLLLVKIDTGLGNFESAHELINICITKARSSIDAFPYSMSLVIVEQSKDCAAKAVEVGVKALSTLGHKVRSHVSKTRFILKVLSMRRRLKRLSDEEILALPNMPNLVISKLTNDCMSRLSIALYMLGREEAGFYMSLRQIEFQLDHGLAAAYCFCHWGCACLSLNDPEEAYRFGKLGIQLHDRCSSESSLPVFYLKNAFLHALKHPLQDTIEPLWSAYNLGFMTGYDPLHAAAAGHIYVIYSFHCGFCLNTLHTTHKKIIAEMDRYGQEAVSLASRIVLQTIENFLGKGDGDVTVLDGAAMNETSLLTGGRTIEDLVIWKRILLLVHKIILSVYFGRECPFAIKELYKISNSKLKGQGFLPVPWSMYVALAALRLAKTGKERKKHLRKTRGIIKDLNAASKIGDVNAHVMNQLVLAELAVVKKEPLEKVKEKFDNSITLARRSGFVNIAGLANTLHAEYFLEAEDKEWSDFYGRQAIMMYQQWNSEMLVSHAETMFGVNRGVRYSVATYHHSADDPESEDLMLHNADFSEAHSGRIIRRISVIDEMTLIE